jgi:superfamily II DNA or RNA helicase/intein/homing endonuclease
MNDTVIQIENVNSRLVTTDKAIKDFLAQKLRFRPKNYWHSSAYKRKQWDGWKYFFNAKNGVFLTGILPEVKLALNKLGKEYSVIDHRGTVEWAHQNIDQNFLEPWWPKGMTAFELHDYQPDYVNQCIKYNRGIVQAPTGCHRAGQEILMFDGRFKKVEKIKVGDKLMGMDSSPRRVLSLIRNTGQMYRIVPTKGESFIVNEDHILSLVRTNDGTKKNGKIFDVSVRDWLLWSKTKKHTHKLFRVGVDFEQNRKSFDALKIDPYFLGVLLGDGSFLGTPNITTTDKGIVQEIKKQAKFYGLNVKQRASKDKCPQYALVRGKKYSFGKNGGSNILINRLRFFKLWGKKCDNKFVPQAYKVSTRENRLAILAGLLDTDGCLQKNYFEITLKSRQLAHDVVYLSKSVGLAAYVKICRKKSQNGTEGVYHRVTISGDTDCIPCRIKYKKATSRKQKKDVLRTGFSVEKLGFENYYGFSLDGDKRYLLSDFTVTHNSGKTFILISLLKCLPPKTPTLFLTKNAQLVHQNYEEMKLWGVENLGRWYDKYKEPNYVMCVTNHVNTFASIEKLLPKFKVLIVDEVHDCMSDVPVSAYKQMKSACVRIGISATAFKWDKKKIDNVHKWHLKGNFGPILKTTTTESGNLTTKELQERGVLSKSDCTFYPVTSPNLAYEPYQDAIKLGIEQNFHFHEMVRKLTESCPGRTLIVVERIEQGQYLNQLIPGSNFVQGKNNLKEREPIINALKQGEKSVAIVMRQIITAGINVKIHDLINAAGGEGAHNVIQLMGRGLRTAEDKERLRYHDFHFVINDYLRKHSEWRMEVLKKEGHSLVIKESFDV